MDCDRKIIVKTAADALARKGAHVATRSVFAGLNWKVAGAHAPPHFIFQLMKHMTYSQVGCEWLDGEKPPPVSTHASGSRPDIAGPASAEEWKKTVGGFRLGLDELEHRSHDTDILAKLGKESVGNASDHHITYQLSRCKLSC